MGEVPDGFTFELDRLRTYDRPSLVAELRRVALLVPGGHLTQRQFDSHSKVHSATISRRFGGWRDALRAAGLEARYAGPSVSEKARSKPSRGLSEAEIIAEIQRVASALGRNTITKRDLYQHSQLVGPRVCAARFGSWWHALQASGLSPSKHQKRHTDDDYFENLLEVWVHYGRTPRYREMNLPPSRISIEGYRHRFGTWGKAREAFLDRVSQDVAQKPTDESRGEHPETPGSRIPAVAVTESMGQAVPLGRRYRVLQRDSFRCVICGNSPAFATGCRLHVDHIVPRSRGGTNEEDNLQTLCESCNLGKGNR